MAEKPKTSPLDVQLSEEQRAELTRRLVDEIRVGMRARTPHLQDYGYLDFAWSLYEQQSQKGISRDAPRYGSADLTSPIGTENVDALASRAVKTVFVEPLWIVEGVGRSAPQAPIVEEFMQWRQEQMRLQQTCKRGFTSALVETGAVLEVCEDAETFTAKDLVRAEPQRDEFGNVLIQDGKLLPTYDEQGMPVPALNATDGPYVEITHTYEDQRRRGATVRRRSMKDFLFLPSHAEDSREVWGHAVRFYLTIGECRRRATAGTFTTDAVEALGTHQEREPRAEHDRVGVTVEATGVEDDHNEKALWRIQCWLDLGTGLQCYIAVVSEQHDVILSLRCDWLRKWRTVYLNPYPCPYSVYGYSMMLTKLLTTIEEHTSWRNMNADRATLKANAPLKRMAGETWDPEIQPFSAGTVIDVTSMNGVMPFEFEDVSQGAFRKEEQCVADAQRVIGLNDIAIGQISDKSRTLGENQMATRESFTRTDDPIGNLQEAMEELGELIHAIEVQSLREREVGLEAPTAVAEQISVRHGHDFEGTFTADLIDGRFRFKPRGSVESADPNLRIRRFLEGVEVLEGWAAINPSLAARLQSPEFGEALLQQWVTEFKPRDKAAFTAPLQPPPMALPPGQGQPPGPPGAAPGPSMGPQFGGDELIASMLAQGGVQ